MTDSTLTFRVDDELKAAFVELAKEQDRNAAQLLRDFMRATVDKARSRESYDEWFRGEVAVGLEAAAKGDVLSDESVSEFFARLHATALSDAKSPTKAPSRKIE